MSVLVRCKTIGMIFVCFFTVVTADLAHAKCATPIFPPLNDDRANWSDLENLRVAPPSVVGIIRRQDLKQDGHGDLNIDFYSITIDATGQSAPALFRELRSKLNDLLFAGSSYSISPVNSTQAAIWTAADPQGAVMVFTLAEIPGVVPIERGAVFLSCISETDFVFSTLEMTEYGLHPVAGNRAFGVHDHGNGSLSIYVKAADRVVDAGIFGVMTEDMRERIFDEGDKVWRRMLDNIAQAYSSQNPRNKFALSTRIPY